MRQSNLLSDARIATSPVVRLSLGSLAVEVGLFADLGVVLLGRAGDREGMTARQSFAHAVAFSLIDERAIAVDTLADGRNVGSVLRRRSGEAIADHHRFEVDDRLASALLRARDQLVLLDDVVGEDGLRASARPHEEPCTIYRPA